MATNLSNSLDSHIDDEMVNSLLNETLPEGVLDDSVFSVSSEGSAEDAAVHWNKKKCSGIPRFGKQTKIPSRASTTTNGDAKDHAHHDLHSHIPVPTMSSHLSTTKLSASMEALAEEIANAVASGATSLVNSHKLPIRETKSNMLRKQKMIEIEESRSEIQPTDYLTPMQKKEQATKDLKRQLKEVQRQLDTKEAQINDVLKMKDSEVACLISQKEAEIRILNDSLSTTSSKLADIELNHDVVMSALKEYEHTIDDLNEEMQRREDRHREIYLIMYQKGEEAARFERTQILEELAQENPQAVTVGELLQKLETTQADLVKWQSIKRHEAYNQAEKMETEAQATLRFLRDSMFHYLTDAREAGQHLRAMVGILGFTEVQLRKIAKAREKNKNRTPSATK